MRDHPRMCGEHKEIQEFYPSYEGSSPHVRGAHRNELREQMHDGIIPACAGSTQRPRVRHLWCRDHPRMCGEHLPDTLTTSTPKGSSPHVRGARQRRLFADTTCGIIPACAGSTLESGLSCAWPWDHPRMCAEHYHYPRAPWFLPGSSPHVRGARHA